MFQVVLKLLKLLVKVGEVVIDIAVAHLVVAVKLVFGAANSLVVAIGIEFSLVQLIETLHKVEILMTREVRCSLV